MAQYLHLEYQKGGGNHSPVVKAARASAKRQVKAPKRDDEIVADAGNETGAARVFWDKVAQYVEDPRFRSSLVFLNQTLDFERSPLIPLSPAEFRSKFQIRSPQSAIQVPSTVFWVTTSGEVNSHVYMYVRRAALRDPASGDRNARYSCASLQKKRGYRILRYIEARERARYFWVGYVRM